ncbi:hypothetical protein V5E97_13720 [Singulisphaera sp. Ch08]|uniref:Neurotransmitter-gated ion-channel ligand-binding domain-containing protein n=1 Tax=Singulisphaera sp. Ch08 TaxID=3120278 RepID=A0AAU7CQ41_9BACT
MGCFGAIRLVLTLSAIGSAPATAPLDADMTPPRVQGKPVEVSIGFYILDFARITSRDESFDVTGYLELNWRDPRTARPESTANGVTRHAPGKIWTPRVFFENALEQPRFHFDPVIEADDEGRVSSWVIVSGKFSVPMNLRQFPFDRQVMSVRIGTFEDESVQSLQVDPALVMVDEKAFVTDWTIEKASARVEPRRYVPGQETYPSYIYQVVVQRQWTFYFWRVLVPLTLLTIVAWAAFWFEPSGLQPQISTCTAALISLVAFNFAIDFSLPKVAYLTFVDKHALIGFGFVTAAAATVTYVHVALDRGRRDRAQRIQRFARWLFLPAYACAVGLNLVNALL